MTRSTCPIAQSLHQSDRTYRTLIERMNEGVVIMDADGIIQFVNQRYCELLGYDRSEVIGQREIEMVMPDHRAILIEKTARRRQGLHDQYELCLRQKSGEPIWCLIHGSPYDDDEIGIHGTMGMVADITQRKQAEQALQRSQHKQRVLLDAIPDLILEIDQDGTYLDCFAGRGFPLIGACTELIGKTLFDQLPPDMARDRMVAVQQALQTGKVQVYEYETTFNNRTYYEEARVVKSAENKALVIVRDVSDRKRFELELQTLTQLQQAILDGADYAIISTDCNGVIQTFNATAERLLGYRAEEVIGKETPIRFHDADELEQLAVVLSAQIGQAIAPGFDVFRHATNLGVVHDQEWTYLTRTGDRIPMVISITALHNAHGQVTGYLGIGRDISVHRQMDAERRQLASVVENSSELIAILAADGTFEFLNHAGQTLLNLAADAIASTRFVDRLHPSDRPTFTRTVMPMLDANSIWNGELNLWVSDRAISVLVNAFRLQPTDKNAASKIAIVAQNVTELKQASEALNQVQAKFRRLFANVPGTLFQLVQRTNGQQSFPFMGYQCSRLLEISRDALQDDPSQFWQMMHPDDRSRVIEAFKTSQQSQLPIEQEWRMTLPSGAVKWVQGVARPERQANGEVLWDGIMIDISDRKRLEEERNQFFNLSPDLLTITDFSGRFLSVNPAVTHILGYQPETFQGELYRRFIHPEDDVKTQDVLDQLATAERYVEIDNRYRHQDGSYRWLSWRAVAVPEKQLVYAIAHDVTEKKQSEDELRRSRHELEIRVQERTAELRDAYQRLSFLVENSPIGVIEWNNEFRVQGWSPKTCEIFGWKLGEVVNRHPKEWAIVYPDDQPIVNQAMHELISGARPHNVCHNRNLTKTGEVIYCEWYNSALFDENGNLVSMLSLVLDVTERQRAEQELKASQERFAIAFNASPIALSITSFPDSTHLLVNNAWVSGTGYSREEAIGKTSQELGLWEYIDERQRFIEQLGTEKQVQNMLIHSRDKWGVLQTILLSSDRIELGGRSCLLSACFNISDRVRAEKALQESKEFSENLIANLQDGFLLLDVNGVHIDVNQAFCDMSGYSRDELIGVGPPHPYWPSRNRATIQQVVHQLAAQDDMDDIELTFQRKNGQCFPVIMTPTVLRDGGGTVTNYMALVKDISHIKLVQEELRRSRDELEVRVEQRTAELADVNAYLQTQIRERETLTEQLLHSNQELEQFAYIASHDLQEPLRAITSYTQLLARRYDGQLDEKADKYIHYIVDGATYMQQLIQDLLTYSRVGRGELNLEPVDLNRVLHQVEKNLDVAIAESHTTLRYDSLPTIIADLNQLTRLLQNLIGNSIKYRGDRPPVIRVTVEEQAGQWQFTIQDNGIGFDPQYAERVFVIFQRLHTRRKYPGTGIGLAICKKIVDRHHGRIWVDSTPNQGSTFYFSIPMHTSVAVAINDGGPTLDAHDEP
jgi:PAS domain S-box-containing protein